MTLAWLLPWAWGALAALLVPLLLHLDRRRALRPLRFAAMRWIATRQRPQRTWRLREPWLLLLRLLLLAAVVAWFAQPLLRGERGAPRHWIAAAPGATFASVDAVADDVHAVWLAPGFPPHDSSAPGTSQPVASLLRELDATLAPRDTLTVLVPRELDGLDDARPVLSRAVEWRVLEGSSPVDLPVAPVVALRYAAADDPALPALRRVFAAWSATERLAARVDDAPLSTPVPADARAIVWVGDTPDADAPDDGKLARRGVTLLHIGGSTDAADAWPPIATQVGGGTRLHLAAFDPAREPALREADVPARLHALLLGDAPPPTRAAADTVRPAMGDVAIEPRETPLRSWLAWIVASLFLLERVVATRAQRGRIA